VSYYSGIKRAIHLFGNSEELNVSKRAQELIADVAEGSMDAFGELYDSLSARVFNYAHTITKSKEMSEDITHDVFIQIHNHAKRIAKMANPVSYIMVATRNHSFNLLKRESRQITDMHERIANIPQARPQYDSLLFEDAFNTLPANQRETVYLHLICGYPHKEIATIQNAPLVTVKWRYAKALSRLREYFAQNEPEEKCNEHI
jgi:RNA polymerase sigma-70 factor (ECF subfamily)